MRASSSSPAIFGAVFSCWRACCSIEWTSVRCLVSCSSSVSGMRSPYPRRAGTNASPRGAWGLGASAPQAPAQPRARWRSTRFAGGRGRVGPGLVGLAGTPVALMRTGLRVAAGALEAGAGALRFLAQVLGDQEEGRSAPAGERPRREAPEQARAAAPPVEEHVDEGAVVTAEVAEPGAEEGAGPELRVDEPWPGYGRMRAVDVQRALRN